MTPVPKRRLMTEPMGHMGTDDAAGQAAGSGGPEPPEEPSSEEIKQWQREGWRRIDVRQCPELYVHDGVDLRIRSKEWGWYEVTAGVRGRRRIRPSPKRSQSAEMDRMRQHADRSVGVRGHMMAQARARDANENGMGQMMTMTVDGMDQAKFRLPRNLASSPSQGGSRPDLVQEKLDRQGHHAPEDLVINVDNTTRESKNQHFCLL